MTVFKKNIQRLTICCSLSQSHKSKIVVKYKRMNSKGADTANAGEAPEPNDISDTAM
jgi:hypothetical protein